MRIGQLARDLGLNAKTIRYYEEIGLLPEPQRTEGGFRMYGATDRERLVFIGKAKAIGLTLEEIREMLAIRRAGGQPCHHLLGLLDHKIRLLEEQIQKMTDFHHELVRLREQNDPVGACSGEVCGIVEHYEAPSNQGARGPDELSALNFHRKA